MKVDQVMCLAATGLMTCCGVFIVQAQTIIDFSEDFAPANWTLSPAVNGGFVEFCGCDPEISETLDFYGPDRFYFDDEGGDPEDFVADPVRLSATITIPFTGTMKFGYFGGTDDLRGWGDGSATFYESLGYSVNGTDHQLSPDSGDDDVFSDDYLDGPRFSVALNAGDQFSFYLESLDSIGGTEDGSGGYLDPGDAVLYIDSFTFSSVPEPSVWAGLTGLGLVGFGVLRRWRRIRK